jgi:hypothetical protein
MRGLVSRLEGNAKLQQSDFSQIIFVVLPGAFFLPMLDKKLAYYIDQPVMVTHVGPSQDWRKRLTLAGVSIWDQVQRGPRLSFMLLLHALA